jgi:hypothetical protein
LLCAPVKLENNSGGVTGLGGQSSVGIGLQRGRVDSWELEMFEVLEECCVRGDGWQVEERRT